MLSGPNLLRWNPEDKQSSGTLLGPLTISPLYCDDKSGQIISARGDTIYFLDPISLKTTRKIFEFEGGAPKFKYSEYWSMLKEGSGYWIASDQSLFFLDMSKQKCILFQQYNGFTTLRSSEIYHMQRERPDELWLLSNTGLYILHPKKGIIARYAEDAKGTFKLPTTNFRHYFKDNTGIYWMATAKGLLRWDRKTGASRLYTIRDGLSNDNLYAVYGDAYGYLWLNSDLGIIQFHPSSGAVRYFTSDDGICNNEGNRISHAKAADGTLYFGSLNGVTAFHPRDFAMDFEQQETAPLVLMQATTADHINSEKNLLEYFYQHQEIKLRPGERLLNLQFGFPDFEMLGKTEFRYRITGIDSSWIQTKTPVIQVLGLGYGSYQLEVIAKDGSGKYASEPFVLPIRVLAPLYLRGYFLIIVFSLIVYFLIWRVRRNLRAIRQQQVALELEVAKRTQVILEDKQLIERQAGLLKRQNEEKNRFFANVTHEFRTPLTLVMGPVNFVMKRPYLQAKDKNMLELASQNAGLLLGLVDDILLLASLETQGINMHEEPIYIESFLSDVHAEFMVLAAQKEIELQFSDLSQQEVVLLADPRLLHIMLSNLLSNAIKYTQTGGMITMGLHIDHDSNSWSVRIADNGRGIHPDDLPHIFERFYQTQRQDAPAEGGAGIGLALVKELTDLMRGTLDVFSNLGKGSVFTITLPLHLVDPKADSTYKKGTPAPHQPTSEAHLPFQHKPCVLIVEDDPGIRQFLEALLGEVYVLQLTSNGQDALAALNGGFTPDLIVTDLMMPIMDGYQLIQELKKHPHYQSIPVLALTARAGAHDHMTTLQLGVDDYLIKPFDEDSLRAVMDTLIARYWEKCNTENTDLRKLRAAPNISNPSADNTWLEKLRLETQEHLGDPSFSVDFLAARMLMGRTMFYREVKRLTGLTPNQYILEARLVRARFMLETQPEAGLKKILQQIGLKDEGNFIQAFKKRFGYAPTQILR